MGAPENLRVIELGPGRGTMINDALRAAKVMPKFSEAVGGPSGRNQPGAAKPSSSARWSIRRRRCTGIPRWSTCPRAPPIILANEFFDALPINQAVKTDRGWHERQVEIGADGKLRLHHRARSDPAVRTACCRRSCDSAPEGAIFEWRTNNVAMELGRRLANDGGAALVIDYGHAESAVGDTFQAVGSHRLRRPAERARHHRSHRPCRFPGAGDTRWQPWASTAMAPVDQQSQFLRRLGI